MNMFGIRNHPGAAFLRAFLGTHAARLRMALGQQDRGASAVELAIITAVLVGLAAAISPRWQADAQREATQYYNALGTKLLTAVQVPPPVRDQANNVYVTVTGRLDGILPWHLTIQQTAGGPVECFRPAGGGGACG